MLLCRVASLRSLVSDSFLSILFKNLRVYEKYHACYGNGARNPSHFGDYSGCGSFVVGCWKATWRVYE